MTQGIQLESNNTSFCFRHKYSLIIAVSAIVLGILAALNYYGISSFLSKINAYCLDAMLGCITVLALLLCYKLYSHCSELRNSLSGQSAPQPSPTDKSKDTNTPSPSILSQAKEAPFHQTTVKSKDSNTPSPSILSQAKEAPFHQTTDKSKDSNTIVEKMLKDSPSVTIFCELNRNKYQIKINYTDATTVTMPIDQLLLKINWEKLKLSVDDVEGVTLANGYSYSEFGIYNEILRYGTIADRFDGKGDPRKLASKILQIVKNIVMLGKWLAKTEKLRSNEPLKRELSLPAEIVRTLKPGTVFQEKAFMSCSIPSLKASQFNYTSSGMPVVHFKINKYRTPVSLLNIGHYHREAEVIFKPGTCFRILKASYSNNIHHFELEEINN